MIISGVTVDWRLSPRVITLPVAVTSITIEDLQDTLLDLEAQETDGILFPHLRNTSGGESLGGGVSVGLTTELQNAVIAFAPRTSSSSTGTATSANGLGTVLVDTAATFITSGILAGATIINITDRSVSSIISVDSETQLTMYALGDGTENDWDIGDTYKVWNEIQCEITGGNAVAVDGAATPVSISPIRPTFGTQVVKTSSSSATLQEQADIEQMSFMGGVLIDAVNGVSGTAFPTGTGRRPSNNFTDARSIATSRGLNTFFILGSFTFGATDILDTFIIQGDSTITTNIITLTAGVSTSATTFLKVTLSGTLSGKIDAIDVIFQVITDMDYSSWLLNCWFEGDVSLTGGGTFIVIDGGVANAPGITARPTFDYANVSTAKSNFLRWSGNIGFKNVTAGNISLNIDSGKVFLESSNTGGTIMIRPEHTVIDDETPIGGMQVIGELLRFAVVSDVSNTATTFKTNLTLSQANVLKDSIMQVLSTIAAAGLKGEVKKILSYNATTKFLTLTAALSGIPAANTKMKIINE